MDNSFSFIKRALTALAMAVVLVPTASSQTVNWASMGSVNADTIKKKIVDNARYLVSYQMKWSKDTANLKKKTSASTLLQIGDNHTRFSDFYRIPYDSIIDNLGKGNINPVEGMSAGLATLKKLRFEDVILHDRNNKSDLIQKTVGTDMYQFVDPTPELEWTLVEGDTVIAGYECQKATVTFGGRDWTAWYSLQVSLPYGPYRFGGLPGLIFQISDSKGHYSFTLDGLEKTDIPMPIYSYAKPKIIKTKRDKALKSERQYHLNPGAALKDMGVILSDKDQKTAAKQRPYNPIELK